jgi:hypothetical protein
MESFLLDWLPNHLLVIHVLILFSVLNPLVIPFSLMYFFVEAGAPFIPFYMKVPELNVAYQGSSRTRYFPNLLLR